MSGTPNDSAARLAGLGGEKGRAGRKSPWVLFGVPAVIIAVILAAVLGGVLGSRAHNNSNKSNAASSNSDGSLSGSSSLKASSSKASSGTTTSSGASSTATGGAVTSGGNVTIVPLQAWDWSKDQAVGMCLGNWLVLERWMNEDWFVSVAGADAWDQWDFTQTLGADKATAALQSHYESWVTEADIETMYQHGINQLRIPTGYWSWIPIASGEPYVNANELKYLEQAMAWSHARGMRVLIDLHGLPGSQNGEESSGHNTTSPAWFGNTVNQGRSDAMVVAVMDWIANSPYRSTVVGIEVINEPRPYTAAQNVELSDYYARSYTAIQASKWPVAMFIHGGFIANELTYWLPFVTARVTNPPSIVFEDHPYPGNFPPQTNSADILTQVCTAANKYVGFPVPIVITEWSIYTGVKDIPFEISFYQSQMKTWAWSGGSHYWTFKLIPSSIQLSIGLDYSQYSAITLWTNSTGFPTIGTAGVSNTTTTANAASFLDSLTGNCGSKPANAAPYNTGTVAAWTQEAAALSSAATVTLKATGTQGSRLRRTFRA